MPGTYSRSFPPEALVQEVKSDKDGKIIVGVCPNCQEHFSVNVNYPKNVLKDPKESTGGLES